MKSLDNADRISKCDAVPDTEVIGGNELVQSCYKTVVRWLSIARDFCVEELYTSQILEPAKIAARFRISTRYTVDISGLVLCRSRPFYDKYYQDNVVSVALIIPGLETAMYLRCRESMLPDSLSGTYTFSSVQPFPLVNRIHPHFLSIKQSAQAITLSELNFLKTNLKDLRLFGRASPALENFCEVESVQNNRRRLASICLSGGILALDMPYYIILTHGDYSEKILISSHLSKNLGTDKLRSMEGKPVRVIVAVWYGIKQEEYPEAIMIEPVNTVDEVVVDNIVGYVRFRGTVKKEDMLSNFSFIPSHPALVEKNGQVEFSHGEARDEFAAKFVQTKSEISGSRFSCDTTLVPPFWEVLDKEKTTIHWVTKLLRRNANVRDCLLYLLKRYDKYGHTKMRVEEIKKSIQENGLEEGYRWLRWAGLIFHKKEHAGTKLIQIEDVATKCLYGVVKKDAINKTENFIDMHKKDVVTCPQISEATNFPMSIVLNTLKDLNVYTLKPYDENGLVLVIENHQTEQTEMNAAKALEGLSSTILNCLIKVHYPLSTTKIVEDVKCAGMSYYVAKKVLTSLEAKDKVKKLTDESGNEFWFYEWDARILDALSSLPRDTFTEEEIRQKCHFPFWTIVNTEKIPRKRCISEPKVTDLKEILKELKIRGLIEENPVGSWAIATDDMEVRSERLMKEPIRKCIERIRKLRTQLPMQTVDWLKEQSVHMLRSEYMNAGLVSKNLTEDAEYVVNEALKVFPKPGLQKTSKKS
jgi:signal recognition particle subunit SEC65